MRKLINIVSEDATTAGDLVSPVASDVASKWGQSANQEASPERDAFEAMKAAHDNYMHVLENSKSSNAAHKLKMLKKIKEILQWMS